VSHPNIRLSVVKQSERPGDGVVIRVYETEGKAVADGWVLFTAFPVKKAYLCGIAETDGTPVAFSDGKVCFSIGAYDMVTLRVEGDANDNFVPELTAEAVNDGHVRLRWRSAGEHEGYNIFRDKAPAFTPTAYNMIAYTDGCTYDDFGGCGFARPDGVGFGPGESFTYKIQAVNRSNAGGVISQAVRATLPMRNTMPPLPVKGLLAMQLRNVAGEYRVAVQWEKPPDLDVASYYIYRSEEKGFTPSPVNKVTPFVVQNQFRGTYMEIYTDEFMLEPDKTYYYRVRPVDYAGNEQPCSPEAVVHVVRL
jgi:hypothetical protein